MQIVWKCPLSDERYLIEKAWERAIIGSCPFHPEGDCGVVKLGSYARVAPEGIRVARFWCPRARASISLLPSFLAARLSGTLAAVEDVVARVEQAGSIAKAVDAVHPPDAADAVGLRAALDPSTGPGGARRAGGDRHAVPGAVCERTRDRHWVPGSARLRCRARHAARCSGAAPRVAGSSSRFS